MNRSTFVANANSINVTVNGINTVVEVKEFSTGSAGWYMNGKMAVTLPAGTTRGNFAQKAKDLAITIDGHPIQGTVKEFSTGSIGWYATGKVKLTLKNGEQVTVQVGGNFTVLKSKEMERATPLPEKLTVQVGMNMTVVGSKEWAA